MNAQEHIFTVGTKVTGVAGKLPTSDLGSDEESLSKTAEITLFHKLNTCYVTINGKSGSRRKRGKKKNEKAPPLTSRCLLRSP